MRIIDLAAIVLVLLIGPFTTGNFISNHVGSDEPAKTSPATEKKLDRADDRVRDGVGAALDKAADVVRGQ